MVKRSKIDTAHELDHKCVNDVDGVEDAVPTQCIVCDYPSFNVVKLKAKKVTRYICKKCGRSYFVRNPNAVKSIISVDGYLMDNAMFDMSTRESVLKLYVDTGLIISHSSVLRRLKHNLPYIKMFSEDALCGMKYGGRWGIDETVIGIRGKSKPYDKTIMKEFFKKFSNIKKSDPKKYEKEWEKARKREIRSGHESLHMYLTAIIDHETRIIISHMTTKNRPNHKQMYQLIRNAVCVAGLPNIVITDKYAAYMPAVSKLVKTVGIDRSIMHIQIRAKDVSTLHIRRGMVKMGTEYVHNNLIESTWARIKRNMNAMISMNYENAVVLINYHIICHNFVRPHSNIGSSLISRHRQTKRIQKTPAMKGGYAWFSKFEEIMAASLKYHKSFLFKLNRNMIKRLTISVYKDRAIILTVKKNTSKKLIMKIDRILQVQCRFVRDRSVDSRTKWRKDVPPVPKTGLGLKRPATASIPSFKVCAGCGLIAATPPEVQLLIGYRKIDGVLVAQSNCNICMAKFMRKSGSSGKMGRGRGRKKRRRVVKSRAA